MANRLLLSGLFQETGVIIPATLQSTQLGSGLSLSANGTLSATGGSGSSAPSVFTNYTASGPLSISDDISIVNSASNLAMTLANGTAAKQVKIKRYGTGTVGVTATIDGTSQTVNMASAGGKEMLTLSWDTALTTWILG